MRVSISKARTNQVCFRTAAALAISVLLPLYFGCGKSEGLGVFPKAVGAADEATAIQTLRTIATAQSQLKASQGAYGTFEALTQAGILDERFAGESPNLKGYRFTMSVSDTEFTVSADPHTTETQPTTGVRHFYLDSTDNTIHVNATQPASKNDPLLSAN